MKLNLFLSFLIGSSVSWATAFQVPQKYLDSEMKRPVQTSGLFDSRTIENNRFVKMKQREWDACHQKQSAIFESAKDSVLTFVESPQLKKDLASMESSGLMKGKALRQPWSGDYWPYAAGLIAARNFDPAFDNLWDWKSRYDYVREYPLNKMIQSEDGWSQLSPAEKYDLIFGSQQGQLTESMWQQGKVYFDRDGDVEGWMGICHGWAPAAIIAPRPLHQVSVSVADGERTVLLNPAEIKGLVSYDWATNSYPSIILGKRCELKEPPMDENGRQTNPECFDLNPGTWHLAIVNRMGAQKKSFVMDATFDYQVWNQPVLQYSYSYFNPLTHQPEKKWKEAMVARSEWTQDPYRQYRAEATRNIVGIRMQIAYVVESRVGTSQIDDESQDIIHWVNYAYDLELNQNNEIIGGEWHQEIHPDFIWTPKAGAEPVSRLDNLLTGSWEAMGSVPDQWQQVSRLSSPRGILLSKPVRAILQKSQKVY
jgi:hypothetical protein